MVTDREYQAKAYQDIRTSIGKGNRRIVFVLPTGGGKGFLGARIMQMSQQKGNPSVFFAANRTLIFQLNAQLERMGVPSNILMAGVRNEYESLEQQDIAQLCTIASRNTAHVRAFKRGTISLPQAAMVMVDECHEALSKSYQDIFKFYDEAVSIGWTATPCRSDGRMLDEYYDDLVLGPSYAELQKLGHLVPVVVDAPDRPDLKGIKASKDYNKRDLEDRLNRDSMIGNIIREWRKNSGGRSTVVFAAGVNHSIHVRNEFRKIGVSAEHIDGKMSTDEQQDILQAAREGDVTVVTNYGVCSTGTDVPRWKYLICARPTKSFSLWRQMGGRPQRPFEGHDHCYIQDHSDNCHTFGYPDEDVAWELNSEKRAEDLPRTERNKPPHTKKDPYKCKKCGTEYRGPQCPTCGHKEGPSPEEIKMQDKELKRLERAACNRNDTPMEKQKYWDKVFGEAIRRGQKVGVAAHRYKERYGVFPTSKAVQDLPRSSQWRMKAKDFYMDVVKPSREAAKRAAELAATAQEDFPW